MEELYKSWEHSSKIFNISENGKKTYGEFFTDLKKSREHLKKAFTLKQLFVLEASNDYQTYVKFVSCLLEKHCVFMSATYQFVDPEFRTLLENETQSSFIYIPADKNFNDVTNTSETNNPIILQALKDKLSPFLVRTSGTSGNKFKFICHSAEAFVRKYHQVQNHFHTTMAFSPADTIAGIETLMEAITHQNTLVSNQEKMTPLKVSELIEKEQIDYFQTTPSFLNLMLISKAFNQDKMKTLKKIAYGSEPALSSSLLAIKEALSHLEFKHTYGMSEIGILSTVTDQKDPARFKFNQAINDFKIEDGALLIKTETRMLGYLNYVNQAPGWFKTGDAAELDSDGYIKILGRTDDLINLAGRKFYPYEVEDLLIRIEGAEDISVTAEKNALIGNVIIAKFLLGADYDEQDFRERLKIFCETQLPSFMCPHKILVTREPFITSRFKKDRKI